MLTQLVEHIYATRRVPSFSMKYRENPTQLIELSHLLAELQRVQTIGENHSQLVESLQSILSFRHF